MGEIGIIKEFDKLGRIVIPKELRKRYGIFEKVEIVPTEEGVLLRSPEYILTKKTVKNSKNRQNTPDGKKSGGAILKMKSCPRRN